ncbi:MAG: MoxR family ATPase [Myxococcota bacterium]|nr:MoxR family ATPase [Myxococcota bacterium]
MTTTPEVMANDLRASFLTLKAELGRHLVGLDEPIQLVLASLLARGHVLLEGGPGLGKTRLVKLLGQLLGLDVGRVQCTPDLMPADILGGPFLKPGPHGPSVEFKPGPVFCQLLLTDEINRANPRTQSALLEAMAEQQVTLGGETRRLPAPFCVLATNNPIEMEGTFPLPEAQADRFLMKLVVQQPTKSSLLRILEIDGFADIADIEPVLDAQRLIAYQAHAAALPASDAVKSLIADIILGTHQASDEADESTAIQLGASPRAGQAMLAAARARAAMAGRLHVASGDVVAVAIPTLRHRIVLSYGARAAGLSTAQVLKRILASLGQSDTI